MHAYVGYRGTRRNKILAQLKSGRNANGFDGRVNAGACWLFHDGSGGFAVTAI